VTADEVGVKMRFDDVFDLEALRDSLSDVLINVTLRIDYNSLAVGSDQIRRVCKTAEIELFEVHLRVKRSLTPGIEIIGHISFAICHFSF
jgi:hypothetical protein